MKFLFQKKKPKIFLMGARKTFLILLLFGGSFPGAVSAARLSVLFGGGSGGNQEISSVRIFITSTSYTGDLGGLSGADAKCQTQANAAGLGGTWKAILSSTTVDARTRLGVRKKPIFDIWGRLIWNPLSPAPQVANGNSTGTDFYQSVNSTVNVTELGTTMSVYTWVGTNGDGLKISTSATNHFCNNWVSANSTHSAYMGYSELRNGGWIAHTASGCQYARNLYCLEDE